MSGIVSLRIGEFSEALRTLSDSSKELPEAISSRMNEVSETLAKYRIQLSETGRDLPDVISQRINEATDALGRYRIQIAQTGREISDNISVRINEVNEAMTRLSEFKRETA